MRQRYAKILIYAIVIGAIILSMIFTFVKPGTI
jgi:hypothetical protein